MLFDLHFPGRLPRHGLVAKCGDRQCVNPHHQRVKLKPSEISLRYQNLHEIWQEVDTRHLPLDMLAQLNEPGLPPVTIEDLVLAVAYFGTPEDREWLNPACGGSLAPLTAP